MNAMKLETKHYAVVAGLIIAIGTQLSGTSHGWGDILTPQFIGGTLVSIGTTIAALFVGSPLKPKP